MHHVDVQAFAERLKVQVVDTQLQGAFAQLVVNRRRARILLSKQLGDPAMRRVAIAHELGHYVLGHPSPPLPELCTPSLQKPSPEAGERDFESEAHGFALELLTPACAVDVVCRRRRPDLTLCAQLSISAWVPIEHAAIRITEASERICAAVLSTREGIAWVSPSRRFIAELGESLNLAFHNGHPLDPRSLAWRVLDRSAPCIAEPVPAEAWLGMPGLPLLEESAPVGQRGAVLTTLWAACLEVALTAPSSVH
jgi:Zn-dependent peptidase ImmA (M78 family)